MATKKKALQIGAGMVGRCIVHDMISDFDFVVLDMSEENLAETKRLYPSVETVIGSATRYATAPVCMAVPISPRTRSDRRPAASASQ